MAAYLDEDWPRSHATKMSDDRAGFAHSRRSLDRIFVERERLIDDLKVKLDAVERRADALAAAVNTWRGSFTEAGGITPDDDLLVDAFMRYIGAKDE